MEDRTPLFAKLGTYLSYGEMAVLAIALIGILLNRNDSDQGFQWITIGFGGLAAIQFLQAYAMVEVPPQDGSVPKKGFLELLPVILRKILYISASVSIIGILFSIRMMAGAQQLLLIGGSGLLVSGLLAGLLILRNGAALTFLRSPLMRAIPLLIIIAYLKFGN